MQFFIQTIRQSSHHSLILICIQEELLISAGTVNTHTYHIYTKLDVHSLGKWRVNATLRNLQDLDIKYPGNKNLTPELAKELAGMVKASSAIKPASFKSGVVTFDNLELGLYLIVQTKSISGYEKVAPFLVSVPLWDKDHYLYEINVSEKFEIKKEPPTPGTPETPDQPGDKLPQTGQVNWPMPVLLILGLALIVTGTALKRKSKHAR